MFKNNQMFRDKLTSWLNLSLSDKVKDFKRAALAEAFGLTGWFITGCEYGATGPGPALKEVMIAWMDAHPDLGPNNPSYQATDFADMGDLG